MSDFNLTTNKVTIPIRRVITRFNKGDFDDLDFPIFPDLDDMLQSQHLMRKRINTFFNTLSQPNMYGIILLLLFYKINPTLCSTLETWEKFSEQVRFNIPMYGVQYPNMKDKLFCLCGHPISEVFVISQEGRYAIMGCVCIQKSSIYNQHEMEKILRVDCSECGKNCPRPKPYDLTQDICKRCINKQNKNKPIRPIEPTVVKSQECIDCKKSIPKNKYRPRCISCYLNENCPPFVKIIEV